MKIMAKGSNLMFLSANLKSPVSKKFIYWSDKSPKIDWINPLNYLSFISKFLPLTYALYKISNWDQMYLLNLENLYGPSSFGSGLGGAGG
jgi:hypothetical protein